MKLENALLNLVSQVTSMSSFSHMLDTRECQAAQNGNMLPVRVYHQQLTVGLWLWPRCVYCV